MASSNLVFVRQTVSTWPFKKVKIQTPLERLVCSVPLPRSWQGDWPHGSEPRLEAALIRITETWDAARFEKKMQAVSELFPLLRASLSPAKNAIAIRESPSIHWRLLDDPDILQNVLLHGWTADFKSILQLNPAHNQLWQALVAVEDEGGFMLCLIAHPSIADAAMLHAALSQLEAEFKNQGPSPKQREILARERMETFRRRWLARFLEPCRAKPAKLKAQAAAVSVCQPMPGKKSAIMPAVTDCHPLQWQPFSCEPLCKDSLLKMSGRFSSRRLFACLRLHP
jgi:hypothetical protein